MRTLISLAFGVLITGAVNAQEQPVAAAPSAARDCSGADYRAFDFWLGAWNVGSDGHFAGTNDVTVAYGGCALREHWQGADGGKGTSLNGYDRQSRQWYQLWIDDRGSVVRLTGGLQGESMVMTSDAPDADGRSHRVTWTPLSPDRVRQHWESRPADEPEWRTLFDGIYQRRGFKAVE